MPSRLEQRPQRLVQHREPASSMRRRARAHQRQLLPVVKPSGATSSTPVALLAQQRRDPNHEELVEVGADDREELHALEQADGSRPAPARARAR